MTAAGGRRLRVALVGAGESLASCRAALRRCGVAPAVIIDAGPDGMSGGRRHAAVAATVPPVLDRFDAAIIAGIGRGTADALAQLVDAGKPVLSQLELAVLRPDHARATNAGWVTCTPWRFSAAADCLRRAIASGVLGALVGFDARLGGDPGRDAQSAAFWDPGAGGGGVLAQPGLHVLDLLAWWLGPLTAVGLDDDGAGGVEAEAIARVRSADGVGGVIELSRLRTLRNSIVVEGTRGRLEVSVPDMALRADPPELLAQVQGGRLLDAGAPAEPGELEVRRIRTWLQAMAASPEHRPELLRPSGAPATWRDLHARRRRLWHVWEREGVPLWSGARARADWSERAVLVTGGTGFIGARLVEALASLGATITLLVRDRTRVARVARFAVAIHEIDLNRADAVAAVAAGQDVVFSLAYDVRRSGAQNLAVHRAVAEGCVRARVRRLVHLSSVAVYDGWPHADLDEAATRRGPGSEYKTAKCAMEEDLARRAEAGSLESVILQPTIVYGPFSGQWTDQFVEWLETGTVSLPRAGLGRCNGVYIDDLIEALLLAAVEPRAAGATYLVNGPSPIAWAALVRGYAAALGDNVEVTESEPPLASTPAKAPSLLRAVWNDPLAIANWRPARKVLAWLRERVGAERVGRLRARVAALRRGAGPVTHRPALDRPELFHADATIDTARIRVALALPDGTRPDEGIALAQAYIRWRYRGESAPVALPPGPRRPG